MNHRLRFAIKSFQLMSDTRSVLVILTPGFPADEADTACTPPRQTFVKALKKNYPSLNIIILAFQYPFESKEYMWHGIHVISFNGRNKGKINRIKIWRQVWRSLQQIKKHHKVIGILSFWLGECALIGKYFATKNGIKHYAWILGQDARKGNRYVQFIKPKATELIALSDFIAEEFNKNYGVKPAHIIPVAIDTSIFKNENGIRYIDIMGAGSLIPLKRYDLFIDVIKELTRNFPHIRAVLCGKGDEKQRLDNMVNDLGLKQNITLTGEVPYPEVISLMQGAKVFLHTSSYEGFGSVCAEALYAGCHVISFCKPMSENIKHWHIVNTKEEMIQKAFEILSNISTEYHPVLYYPAESAASSMMELFKYP